MATDRQRIDSTLDEVVKLRALLWAAQCVLLDMFALMDDVADMPVEVRGELGDRWLICHADIKHYLEIVPWMSQPAEVPDCAPNDNPISTAEPCS